MATFVWAINCQRVLTDRETNSVTYVQTVEQLALPRLPYSIPPIVNGSLWRADAPEESLTVRVRLVSPSGVVVGERATGELRFSAATQRFRVNLGLAGVELTEFGIHHIVVEQLRGSDWKEEVRLPLEVTEVQPEKRAAWEEREAQEAAARGHGPMIRAG
jgi:hypothetical protein